MSGTAGVRELAAPRRLPTRWIRRVLSSPYSVRAYVVGLILAVVAPLLMFSAFLVLRSAEHEQEIMASTVRERTGTAAATIDHELAALRSRLFILAASNNLLTGDLAAFHAEATAIGKQLGLTVVLSDAHGQQLVNTNAEFGESLPVTSDPDAVQRVATTGMPDISDLTRDPITRDLFIAMNVPVMRQGKIAHVLSFNIIPALPTILAALNMPPDWIVTISDRRGYTLARSREADRFVGQMGRAPILDRLHAADRGSFPVVTREGVPVYNAFAHVKLSGWVVAVGIPDNILYAPVQHSTTILSLVGGVSLIVALLLAAVIGQRVARPITTLAAYADVVGRGERVIPRPTGIKETDAVAESLHQASERLRQSAAERDQVVDELRDSEQRFRGLAADLTVANQERKELLHRTVTAQEAERKRIARELHDSLGQYLTALRLGFNAIEPHCTHDDGAQRQLTELKNLAADLGRDLNRMAWELRPMALDHLGLRTAVTQYLEEWAERSGIQMDAAITLGDHRLPREVETAMFRVLQEAITNVMKHSGASRVGVILEATGDEVRLIVEDNGRGFDLDSDTARALGMGHLGLLGVRERLALVGGNLEVESAPNGGTTIYVRVPIGGDVG
jgi:signal transduction histidine kinase